MKGTPQSFDVVVVGAGAVGASLTLALTQAGLRTALLDAGAAPSSRDAADERAYAVAPASMRQWRVLGVAGPIAEAAQEITSISVTDARPQGAAPFRGRSGFVRFDAGDLEGDGPVSLGQMVESRYVGDALNDGLRASDATLFYEETLSSVDRSAGRARLSMESGLVLSASLVVGADGRRSRVRGIMGEGVAGWSYGQHGLVATVALSRPHEGVAHEMFFPTGPLAVLPLRGQRASLVWSEHSQTAAALAAAPSEAFEALLNRRLGERLGTARLLGARRCFPLSLQVADAFFTERFALVGDAAHGIHPVAGQGLNLGLKDVASLAEVLAEAHRLGEDIGSALVLQRYGRWRRFDVMTAALAADAFTRLFSTAHPLARLARGVGLGAVDRSPALRRFFAMEATGARGDVPRLLRGERA